MSRFVATWVVSSVNCTQSKMAIRAEIKGMILDCRLLNRGIGLGLLYVSKPLHLPLPTPTSTRCHLCHRAGAPTPGYVRRRVSRVLRVA
jgi:hypothetical protein